MNPKTETSKRELALFNMILVWAGTAEIGNQVYTWGDILLSAVLYGVLFLPFLSSRVFQEKA